MSQKDLLSLAVSSKVEALSLKSHISSSIFEQCISKIALMAKHNLKKVIFHAIKLLYPEVSEPRYELCHCFINLLQS